MASGCGGVQRSALSSWRDALSEIEDVLWVVRLLDLAESLKVIPVVGALPINQIEICVINVGESGKVRMHRFVQIFHLFQHLRRIRIFRPLRIILYAKECIGSMRERRGRGRYAGDRAAIGLENDADAAV